MATALSRISLTSSTRCASARAVRAASYLMRAVAWRPSLGFSNQRACAHRTTGNNAGASGVDFELSAFTDRADAETKDITTIGIEPRSRIASGFDQPPAHCQNRSARPAGDTARRASVRARQLGADDLSRNLAWIIFGAVRLPKIDGYRSRSRANRGRFHFVQHTASRDGLGALGLAGTALLKMHHAAASPAPSGWASSSECLRSSAGAASRSAARLASNSSSSSSGRYLRPLIRTGLGKSDSGS